MGALIGLMLGVGLLMVVGSFSRPATRDRARRTDGWAQRRADMLRQAGLDGVSHLQLLALR